MNELIDKKIGNEIDGGIIADVFQGYSFKVTGGFDKDGFAMKNGILTQAKKKIMLTKGDKMFRFKKGYHRRGAKERRVVRGCIVSPDIKILNLKIIKRGPKEIPGLTEKGCELPKRLGPKRANKILKEFGLTEVYKEKKNNKQEKDNRKNLRYMITKFAPTRKVTSQKGKTYTKRAKIQRLVTPLRLRRKRVIKAIKKQRRETATSQKKEYKELMKKMQEERKKERKDKKEKKKEKKN